MELIDQAIEYLRDGFGSLNNPKGLLIALVATIVLSSWKQWVPVAAVATVIHIVIERLAPVLAGGRGNVTLPPIMEESFWTRTLVLFLGYMVIIGVFFLLKSMLFKSGGSSAKA